MQFPSPHHFINDLRIKNCAASMQPSAADNSCSIKDPNSQAPTPVSCSCNNRCPVNNNKAREAARPKAEPNHQWTERRSSPEVGNTATAGLWTGSKTSLCLWRHVHSGRMSRTRTHRCGIDSRPALDGASAMACEWLNCSGHFLLARFSGSQAPFHPSGLVGRYIPKQSISNVYLLLYIFALNTRCVSVS